MAVHGMKEGVDSSDVDHDKDVGYEWVVSYRVVWCLVFVYKWLIFM